MSGTPQVLLSHHLKQLKLSTVLRDYDKVARDCARDGVDHPRYLLRLVELELINRVAFTSAAALLHQLMEARDEKRLLKLQRELQGGEAAHRRRARIRAIVGDRS